MSQRAVLGSGVVITGQDERTTQSSISRGVSGLEFQRADPRAGISLTPQVPH